MFAPLTTSYHQCFLTKIFVTSMLLTFSQIPSGLLERKCVTLTKSDQPKIEKWIDNKLGQAAMVIFPLIFVIQVTFYSHFLLTYLFAHIICPIIKSPARIYGSFIAVHILLNIFWSFCHFVTSQSGASVKFQLVYFTSYPQCAVHVYLYYYY